MTVAVEIQSFAPSSLIELFILDTTIIPGGGLHYFHAGTNGLNQPVIWQGNEFLPIPIEAEGFDVSSQGTLPRPKIRVANVQSLFSVMISDGEDLVGCRVTRKRTFARYLDAVNFPGGNPDADPNQHLPDDLFFIDRKTSENRFVIEWELASAFDLDGVLLPRRQVIQSSCPWVYRSAECGYTGLGGWNSQDTVVPTNQDVCGKHLTSCRLRFGDGATLPFGGFPGVLRV